MDHPAPPPRTGLQPGDIAGALAWWREAGVDLHFGDVPTAWLTDQNAAPGQGDPPPFPAAPGPHATTDPAPAAQAAPFGGERAQWPTTLDAFARWWVEDPALDEGLVRNRVAPRGPAEAPLMVIVPQPEAADDERLLGGPEGRLLDAMLQAMELDPEAVRVAAVLPRHTPMVDWAQLAARGAGDLLAHHIHLAAPQRLIVFGSTILPLLGHDPTHSAQTLPSFNHEGRTVPLLAARELGALLARPQWKAGFWRNWLDWTGPLSA